MKPAQVTKPHGQQPFGKGKGVQTEWGYAHTTCAFAEYATAAQAEACVAALNGFACEALGPGVIQVCHFLFL